MARRRKGRDVSGIVVIDKPTGASSNHVLQQVRRLYDANKAGHTGSLDPLASGVLPVCLGEATKLSTYLLDADKQYLVTCRLGVTTDSGDADGQVIAEQPVPEYNSAQLRSILDGFLGEQQQVPPMFSALKHQGQPLYKLARQGVEVERKPRHVRIYVIDLVDCDPDSFTLSVRCSKGTYIRTLVEDISLKLGCGGHVVMLRRTAVAGYTLQDAWSLDRLRQALEEGGQSALDGLLLPPHAALADWPAIRLDDADSQRIVHGQPVQSDQPFERELVCLFNAAGCFLGIGAMSPDGSVRPKRLLATTTR